jgi:hypothetical protein
VSAGDPPSTSNGPDLNACLCALRSSTRSFVSGKCETPGFLREFI